METVNNPIPTYKIIPYLRLGLIYCRAYAQRKGLLADGDQVDIIAHSGYFLRKIGYGASFACSDACWSFSNTLPSDRRGQF